MQEAVETLDSRLTKLVKLASAQHEKRSAGNLYETYLKPLATQATGAFNSLPNEGKGALIGAGIGGGLGLMAAPKGRDGKRRRFSSMLAGLGLGGAAGAAVPAVGRGMGLVAEGLKLDKNPPNSVMSNVGGTIENATDQAFTAATGHLAGPATPLLSGVGAGTATWALQKVVPKAWRSMKERYEPFSNVRDSVSSRAAGSKDFEMATPMKPKPGPVRYDQFGFPIPPKQPPPDTLLERVKDPTISSKEFSELDKIRVKATAKNYRAQERRAAGKGIKAILSKALPWLVGGGVYHQSSGARTNYLNERENQE